MRFCPSWHQNGSVMWGIWWLVSQLTNMYLRRSQKSNKREGPSMTIAVPGWSPRPHFTLFWGGGGVHLGGLLQIIVLLSLRGFKSGTAKKQNVPQILTSKNPRDLGSSRHHFWSVFCRFVALSLCRFAIWDSLLYWIPNPESLAYKRSLSTKITNKKLRVGHVPGCKVV